MMRLPKGIVIGKPLKLLAKTLKRGETDYGKDSGMPGTSRYITTKNRKNTTERLELKKYNPILKRVTVHKEIK